jgi:hypothetical protein
MQITITDPVNRDRLLTDLQALPEAVGPPAPDGRASSLVSLSWNPDLGETYIHLPDDDPALLAAVQAVIGAHSPALTPAQTYPDRDREELLTVVQQRAATDPAYAALAKLTLGEI